MNELITVINETAILDQKMIDSLLLLESRIKELKDIEEQYKQVLKEEMEKKKVLKLTDEISGLTISYIEGQTNLEKFNKEKFRSENPDMYDKYVTMNGKKAAYITFRIK